MRTVIHVITSLDDGGAEAALYRLIKSLPSYEHHVVSLSGSGKYGSMLCAEGAYVYDLRMSSTLGKVTSLFKLRALIKSTDPVVIQTWMYHADIVGGLAAYFAGFYNVVWGIHNSTTHMHNNSFSRYVLIRVSALLSSVLPRKIITCSTSGLKSHERIGFPRKKLHFVPNGHLLEEYKTDAAARNRIRQEFSVSPDDVLLGMVARFDPQKDHSCLLDALALLKRQRNFRCLLVGKGLDVGSVLGRKVKNLGLTDQVIFAGQRSDIPSIMNALDVFCLSSNTEAFSNVLCEAMACGTPCVATDVGDNAFIIHDTGWVVPPGCPEKFADALRLAIDGVGAESRSRDARLRIIENFSAELMGHRYEKIWLR